MSAAAAAPESVLPYPPIKKDAKFVVLSDWDGTITDKDSNDFLTDKLGFGFEKRSVFSFLFFLSRFGRSAGDADYGQHWKTDEHSTLKSSMAGFLSETLSGRCSSLSRCLSRSARRSL